MMTEDQIIQLQKEGFSDLQITDEMQKDLDEEVFA